MAHQPPPAGWPQMTPCLFYRDAARAIDWLCEAFGFEVRLKVEGEPGQILHSELTYGTGMIMVNGTSKAGEVDERGFRTHYASPLDVEGRMTQSICMYVDDVEAHAAQARACGAEIVDEVSTHDYGDDYWTDRSYGVRDLEGHQWWFSTRIK
jgi:uncharacterized glyoxalase superfamily protein PhnB